MGCFVVQVRISSAQSAPPETIWQSMSISARELLTSFPREEYRSGFLALAAFLATFCARRFLLLRLSLFCLRLTRRFSWLGGTALFLCFRLRLTRRFSWLGRAALFLCFRLRLPFAWLASRLTITILVFHIGLWQRLLLAFSRLRPCFFRAAPRFGFLARGRFTSRRFPLASAGFPIALLARRVVTVLHRCDCARLAPSVVVGRRSRRRAQLLPIADLVI